MPIETQCPACKTLYRNIPDKYRGKQTRCKKCGEKFSAQETRRKTSQSIELICPQCGLRKSNVPFTSMGKKARCKRCGQSFRVEEEVSAFMRESGADSAPSTKEDRFGFREWNVGDVVLDLYEVVGRLGEGGMGKVFKARHRGWEMDLAIKNPRAEIIAQAGGVDNFIREAETWVNIPMHPHIVSCYYVRRIADLPSIFAEYVDGGSLKEWIRENRLYRESPTKSLDRIMDIAIQFAWGLDFAHEQGLIHQDVKPANVMLTSEGLVKVTDFGLSHAKAMDNIPNGSPDEQVTMVVKKTGMTPAYASPEQSAGGLLSRRTDVYSWAVSILEVFTGKVLWPVGTVAPAVMESFLEQEPDRPDIPVMPADVADLLRKCFHENPDQRYHDMAEIAEELIGIYKKEFGQAYPRRKPKAGKDMATTLNNRALSLLDLGRKEEAMALFDQALEIEPHHPEATYNQRLIQWRNGEVTDQDFVHELEEVSISHQQHPDVRYLLGLIHAERGDYERASELFDNLPEKKLNKENSPDLHAFVKSHAAQSRRCMWTIRKKRKEDHREEFLAGALNSKTGIAVTNVSISFIAPSDPLGKTNFYYQIECRNMMTGEKTCAFESQSDITSITTTRNGRYAITGDFHGKLIVWDLETKQPIKTIHGHNGAIASVSTSREGNSLLSSGSDCMLKLWNLIDGLCIQTFKGHIREVNAGLISDDGQYVLSGAGGSESRFNISPELKVQFVQDERGAENTAQLWETTSGKCVSRFQGHGGPVTAVALSRDVQYVLTGSADRTIKLWEAKNGRCIRTLRGHIGKVTSVSISPDSKYALSGGLDGTVRIWELSSGRCLFTSKGLPVTCISLGEDWRHALSVSGGALSLLCTGISLQSWSAPWQICRFQRSEAALTDEDQFERYMESAKEALENKHYTYAAAQVKLGRAIAGYTREPRGVELWQKLYPKLPPKSLEGGWKIAVLEGHEEAIRAVTFIPDSNHVLSTSDDRRLKLWRVTDGTCIKTFEGHAEEVTAVSVSRDGRVGISSGGYEGLCRAWDLRTGEHLNEFGRHDYVVSAVAIRNDGNFAVSGDSQGIVHMWEMASGRCVRTFDTEFMKGSKVVRLQFSRDGKYILVAGSAIPISIWDAETGSLLRICEGHERPVRDASLCNATRHGLSASDDQTIKLWDLHSGKCLRTFGGHTGPVSSVSFSPDDQYVISGSFDHTIKIWKVSTGECLRTFIDQKDKISSVAISADWRHLVSGSINKTITIWALDWCLDEPKISVRRESSLFRQDAFEAQHVVENMSSSSYNNSFGQYAQELVSGLASAEWSDAMALIKRIKATHAKQLYPKLVDYLKAGSPMAMAAAAQILADWNISESVPQIADALKNYPYGSEPDKDMKPGLLCDALLRLGDPRGAPAVWSAYKKGASRAVLMSSADQRSFHERALEMWENYGEQGESKGIRRLATPLIPPGHYVGLWGMKSLHSSTTERWAYVDIIRGTGISFQSSNKRAAKLEQLDKKVQTWKDYGKKTFPAFWNTSRYKDRSQQPAFPDEADVLIGPLETIGFDAETIIRASPLQSQIYDVQATHD